MLVVVSVLVINFYPSFGKKPSTDDQKAYENSTHYSNGKFSNIAQIKEDFTFSDYRAMISKAIKGTERKSPESTLPVKRWNKEELENIDNKQTTAIWYGHSSFLVKMDNKNILLDPMFSDYPAPVPYLMTKRFAQVPIEVSDLPEIDVVVLSHDHYDHLDYQSILDIKNKTKLFLVPLGVGSHLKSWGVNKDKIIELDWNQSKNIGGINFVCTPSQHFSGRGFSDKMSTLWSSWVIQGSKKLFFSGDSGYFDGFKEIGNAYGPFDVCFMECGQYDTLWSEIHMFPEETGQAHLDLKGDKLVPIHWGGFALANHAWDDSIERLKAFSLAQNITLETPTIGQPIIIGGDNPTSSWWENLK